MDDVRCWCVSAVNTRTNDQNGKEYQTLWYCESITDVGSALKTLAYRLNKNTDTFEMEVYETVVDLYEFRKHKYKYQNNHCHTKPNQA